MAHRSLIDVLIYGCLLGAVDVDGDDRCECHHWYDDRGQENILVVFLWVLLLYCPNSQTADCPKGEDAKEYLFWLRRLVVVFFRDKESRVGPHHLSEVFVALSF